MEPIAIDAPARVAEVPENVVTFPVEKPSIVRVHVPMVDIPFGFPA